MSDDRGVSPEMSRAEQAPVTSPGPVHDEPREPTSGEGRPGGGSGNGSGEWPVDPSRKMLALAGVIAGAAGIALSQAAAGALRVESSPVEAVAAAVRDFTPGPIAVFLVHLVGSADKPLLLGGTAIAVLGMCGYAASLMRRHPLLPDLVFFALTVIGLAAILRLPSPGIGSALALMVGLVTWIVTLRVLTAPLLGEVVDDHTPDLRRRDFLIRSVRPLAGRRSRPR